MLFEHYHCFILLLPEKCIILSAFEGNKENVAVDFPKKGNSLCLMRDSIGSLTVSKRKKKKDLNLLIDCHHNCDITGMGSLSKLLA